MNLRALAFACIVVVGLGELAQVQAQGCNGGGYSYGGSYSYGGGYYQQPPGYYQPPLSLPGYYAKAPNYGGYYNGGYCPPAAYAPQGYYPQPGYYGGNPYYYPHHRREYRLDLSVARSRGR